MLVPFAVSLPVPFAVSLPVPFAARLPVPFAVSLSNRQRIPCPAERDPRAPHSGASTGSA